MRFTFFQTHRSFSVQRPSRFISLSILASVFISVLAFATEAWANYVATNLVSDVPGIARRTDTNVVNPWGIAVGGSGTIWVANNGTGTSTLYDTQGVPQPLVVTIPSSATNTEGANPTGIVVNSSSGFVVSEGGVSGPSVFIFVSEDGSISGWSPSVALDHAIIAVDDGKEGSVYKGAALGESSSGLRLFVTNFREGKVSIYDDTFAEIEDDDAFVDPNVPATYSPFGIENIPTASSMLPTRNGTGTVRTMCRGRDTVSSLSSTRMVPSSIISSRAASSIRPGVWRLRLTILGILAGRSSLEISAMA